VNASAPPKTTSKAPSVLIVVLLVAAACATNVCIISGIYLPWIGPIAGFLLAICLPAWMLSQKIDWRTDKPSERLCLSVVAAILALILLGLAINTVLPLLGISHPLDRGPVLTTIDIWCGALALWRPTRFTATIPHFGFDRLEGTDWTVGILSALCVPAAVVGANRLNNGAGGSVTLGMLIMVVFIFTLILIKREQLNPGTITAAIYFISLAMLLMTSLRGWYTTGHDIQTEYRVFELTKTHGDWNISRYRNGYNACLSITILPTMLWQVTRVDDPYIYKVFFQLLFALCPVFVYRISLRHTTTAPAVIATIYFLAFPTFFTDMPFLNRQEIAFLFVAACVMTATDPSVSPRKIRVRIAIFSIGVVLSHYSTTYVFFGTLAIGWISYKTWFILASFRNARREISMTRSDANPRSVSPAISLLNVVLVLVGIILWNGVATQTVSGLSATLAQAVESLRGGSPIDQESTGVSYSLFSTGAPSMSQELTQYATTTLAQTSAERKAGIYYPEKLIKSYPIKLVTEPNLPITGLGRMVDDTGLSVSALNSFARAWSAKLLQIFIAVGLIGSIVFKRRRSRSFIELIALGCGALAIVVLQVVLPVLSVDYGVERAFQQALIVLSPFVAIGSSMIFKPLPKKWGLRASSITVMLFFLSLTGVFPQVFGGYPAQLHLDNSGQYYDIYYLHVQEITGIDWLQSHIPVNSIGQIQSEVETDRYTFNQLQTFTGLSSVNDIYPTLLRKDAYVFLGYTTVTKDQATFLYAGDLIAYQYPMGLLNSTKNLIYSSNGVRIYR
jgi:uncharacterized membrane protein